MKLLDDELYEDDQNKLFHKFIKEKGPIFWDTIEVKRKHLVRKWLTDNEPLVPKSFGDDILVRLEKAYNWLFVRMYSI